MMSRKNTSVVLQRLPGRCCELCDTQESVVGDDGFKASVASFRASCVGPNVLAAREAGVTQAWVCKGCDEKFVRYKAKEIDFLHPGHRKFERDFLKNFGTSRDKSGIARVEITIGSEEEPVLRTTEPVELPLTPVPWPGTWDRSNKRRTWRRTQAHKLVEEQVRERAEITVEVVRYFVEVAQQEIKENLKSTKSLRIVWGSDKRVRIEKLQELEEEAYVVSQVTWNKHFVSPSFGGDKDGQLPNAGKDRLQDEQKRSY